jgi:EAL domain-containing protein (putative c-di-GMP-specific phosphodiesterase class I)/GGDEF domain-containing protein
MSGGNMPHDRIDGLLRDPITQLPLYLDIIDKVEKQLIDDNAVGMLYIDVSGLEKIETNFGSETYENIIKKIAEEIKGMKGKAIRNEDLLTVSEPEGSSFLIFLSEKRRDKAKNDLTRDDVEMVSDRVYTYLFSKLFFIIYPYIKERPRISVGYSFVVNNPLIKSIRLVYKLIDEAKQIAKLQRTRTEVKNKEKLQRIILDEKITTLYQPIVNLTTFEVIGYEALTRGPLNTEFETPIMLFALAEETGLVFELDRLCRKKALLNAKDLKPGEKLFINTLPTTIHDPEFRGKYLQEFLNDVKIKPDNLVFEITERSAIENYPLFKEAVDYYTDIGVAIAIDDTGTGYSTLESIIELKPGYLKFDISMVKNIDKSFIKKEMLRTLKTMATNIRAHVIAEGIETVEELETLKKLDIPLGQGYLIARPGPPFPAINKI